MLIPSLKITQSDDCLSVSAFDNTGWYDSISNLCGYSPVPTDESPAIIPVNPTRPSITRTAITITTPSGEVIHLAKTYLPSQALPLTITCADLIISSVAPAPVTNDNCGCGMVTSVLTPTAPASCFFDGCWTFQYDVFATETLVTYEWDITSFDYPGYCATLIIDGVAISVGTGTAIADEAALLALLNTLDSGYFTIDSHILSVSSFSHTYGIISSADSQRTFIFNWEVCTLPTFPATFISIKANGTTIPIGLTVNSFDEVVTIINNLGLGTIINGGGTPTTHSFIQTSCGSLALADLFISSAVCPPTVGGGLPIIQTFNNTTESVDEEVLVGTKTQREFLYCNVKKLRKNFKLTQLKAICNCSSGLVCEMDSDYETMKIAAKQGGNCDCRCAENYLRKVQKSLGFLLKECP